MIYVFAVLMVACFIMFVLSVWALCKGAHLPPEHKWFDEMMRKRWGH